MTWWFQRFMPHNVDVASYAALSWMLLGVISGILIACAVSRLNRDP
jgi:hypothetical protein